jgi:hypothetical protein
VASVALWCGRDERGFSDVASRTGCGGVTSVHCSAGQGWRRVWDSMSCQCVHDAGLGNACVHGNSTCTLGTLGSSAVLV